MPIHKAHCRIPTLDHCEEPQGGLDRHGIYKEEEEL